MQICSEDVNESKPYFQTREPMDADEFLDFLDQFWGLFPDCAERLVIQVPDARL